MALDLDPFDDILSEPTGRNARAGAKFQPKAKPQPRREKHSTVPTSLTDVVKDTIVTTETVDQDNLQSVSLTQTPDVMSCTTTLTDSLPKIPQNQELGNSTEVFHSGFSLPDGDINSPPVGISSQYSELTIPDTHGDLQSGVAGLGIETAEIFSGFDEIFCDTTASNAASTARKFQPRIKVNAQPNNNLPPLCAGPEGYISHDEVLVFHASNVQDVEGGCGQSSLLSVDCSTLRQSSLSPPNLSPKFVSQEKLHGRESGFSDYREGFLIDTERLGVEEQAFPGLDSFNAGTCTTSNGNSQSFLSEIENINGNLHPASAGHDSLDFSTSDVSHPSVPDCPSEFPASGDSTHHDAPVSHASVPQEGLESLGVPIISGKKSTRNRKTKSLTEPEDSARKIHPRSVEELSQETLDERPSIAADKGIESGKPSRGLRKRSIAPVLADEMEDGTEKVDPHAEPSNHSLVDEDVDDDGGDQCREDTSCRKRAAKKAKPAEQNEKTGRRRKKSVEGPDALSKEPPKKKFSHSTRRNRRSVNKALLETPEDEIDPQNLPIKDLILLGELREKRMKKDGAASNDTLPNQSVNNLFPEDDPYNQHDPFANDPFGNDPFEDDPFGSEQVPKAAPLKLNYHSFMTRNTSKKRWSKQDTELFYEAIRQFGTDFAMIEKLFPGRERRQWVLKYKNEERRHPMKLHDALTNRLKDHSHLELAIEKLKQAAAEAEQNSDYEMESVGVSGEAEDNSPETNEVAKSEQNAEVPNDLGKEEALDDYGHVKTSPAVEDEAYKQSPCNSDYDDYVGY
ncbi:Transcription factor TFIIIB component B'' like [Thalictrum thalictroides]|uniref:Transcription factor TFIIIB component B'' like n=1 Tax=Thalictrum thalictroides TaxID=46969 RepID=A0A7J6WBT5_THATH|nr:Transcription factor TFIIIB component B'' like [Thalictrum thalictroides]